MKPEIAQQMFDFDDSSAQPMRLMDSSLRGQIAKLQTAAEKGVARSPEDFKAQQTLDYVYQLLCDDAPNVWSALCSRCRAIFKGLEDYERS